MSNGYKIEIVPIEKPSPEINVILGHTHFIKTVEDLYEAIMNSVPGVKFGLAFCEASGKRLIRYEGTDEELIKYCIENAKRIGAGHTFIIMLRNAYPINVLNAIKNTVEVCRIYAATANPLQVIVIETDQGRGVIGVVDGYTPLGVESDEDIKERKEFLRSIGYKR
ncbi:MAG: adenosine monophosphate-protein transferase [Thermoplasmata archaeon]|nr:adenosine-specific kinase [Euryarchaeota archaeon]RLF64983.1 MAG: adenosine monophosphate-protein transferase [Thermoplasmata archaeon]